jgi:hypothetical protein
MTDRKREVGTAYPEADEYPVAPLNREPRPVKDKAE